MPLPDVPPPAVVPYSTPAASFTSPAVGAAPSAPPLKLCSTVKVAWSEEISNTVPDLLAPPAVEFVP